MNYDHLAQLHDLRQREAITEEEYLREKQKLLAATPRYWGMDERTCGMVLHLSQLLSFVLPPLGLVAPIVIWAVFKDRSPFLAAQGRQAINWIITSTIAAVVLIPLCFILIGIPLLLALGLASVVFCIIAGVKAMDGQVWRYPLSFRILS